MNYVQKRNLILVGLIFLIGAVFGSKILIDKQIIFIGPEYAEVIEVIDGDTFKIKAGETVRLIGIDAPDSGSCYAEEAKNFLVDLVLYKQVRLEKDISNKDQYGRLLRYVILPSHTEDDDVLVNQVLVRQGYALAQHHPPDVRFRGLLAEAQSESLEEKLGIWQECYYAPVEPDREMDTEPLSQDCIIKGNVSGSGYGKMYFLPNCKNYDKVKIDPRLGDRYFCTEEEAQKAGFSKSENCP